jgi:SNF2 family DNA or RNA helicase
MYSSLNDGSPMADDLPGSIGLQLKPHQRTSLHACMRMESEPIVLEACTESPHGGLMRTNFAVLGDKAGSGKSYVLLSLVYATKHWDDVARADVMGLLNGITIENTPKPIDYKVSIIVVPHNLAGQWDAYARVFASELSYLVLSRKKQFDVISETDLTGVDMIIVTNTFYNKLSLHLSSRKVRRVIFDEADTICIAGNMRIDASFYWYVSASFTNMLYNSDVIKSNAIRQVFYQVRTPSNRYIAWRLVVANQEEFVNRSMNHVVPHIITVRCRSPPCVSVLDGVVERHILSALNADDVPTALQHISPTHKNTENNIIAVLVERYSRELNNLQRHIEVLPSLEFETDAHRSSEVARLDRKRAELVSSIAKIRERVTSSSSCCICYEEIVTKTIAPCCSNAFCFKCICKWISHKHVEGVQCPLCKSTISASALYVVQNAATPVRTHNKITNLTSILSKLGETGARILIFSSHTFAFAQITNKLSKLRIGYQYLKGNASTINSIVERYKSGETPVLLVNPEHYGSGLNLEITTDIIMYHQIKYYDSEKQIIGRAIRVGRRFPLRVWNLCHDNELEHVRTNDAVYDSVEDLPLGVISASQ